MTIQKHDYLTVDQNAYWIIGLNGRGYFKPASFGLRPVGLSSNCWRGFVCGFKVRRGWLRLDDLLIGLSSPSSPEDLKRQPPDLFGVHPRWHHGEECWSYRRLNHVVPYSGGILVGDDFVRMGYCNMGYHPAFKFRTVHELIFRYGRFIRSEDRSAQMEQIREQITLQKSREEPTREEVVAWIASTFSLAY